RLDHDAADDAHHGAVLPRDLLQRQPAGARGHVVRAVLGAGRDADAPLPRRGAVVGAPAVARHPRRHVRRSHPRRSAHLRELAAADGPEGPPGGGPAGLTQPCPTCLWAPRPATPTSASAAPTSARCDSAWGVLPAWRPLPTSYSSDSRPTSLANDTSRFMSSSASAMRPVCAYCSTSQNEHARKGCSPPARPSSVALVR